ncbi:addiction module protein [Paraliomyxa miuraensis]|uniref:addiction module protein n=1 Tax=Paraliomyxa miuraensis TaxID=376150 RepID=UPI003899E317
MGLAPSRCTGLGRPRAHVREAPAAVCSPDRSQLRSTRERASLASLDGEPDEDVEAAWAAEIECRVRRLDEEGSRGRPWQEVFDG